MGNNKILRLLICFLCFALSFSGLYAQRSWPDKTSGWSAGLMAGLFARGVKADSQVITSTAPAGLLMVRGKNLGGTVDLTFYAGYGSSRLNGLLFETLPVSLDYQAGGIGGPLFGVKADWPVYGRGDYTFGLTADFFTFFGQKRKFALEDFAEPGEARMQPTWNQASSGIFFLYDGFEYFQPYVVAGVSFFWGTFKASETIADLNGSQSLKLKGSGILILTVGSNVKLAGNLCLIPQLTIYPASRTALAGGLGLLYSF